MSQPRATSVGTGSRNELTRQHNLSTILTLVHRDGPLARAELTRRTGLNRSTVGALVGDLVDRGWVIESPATQSRTVGRPSPIVSANGQVAALVVNPDIDAVVIGLVGLGGVVHKRIRYDTSATPSVEEALRLVAAVVEGMRKELESDFQVMGVGVAIPGLVRSHEGVVTRAPHLEWRDEPVGALMVERIGFPATVGNDAEMAMVAESIFGAGRGVDNLVYLNGSASGIGGGALVGGMPLRGHDGYAGELGHTLVTSDGEPCHCGRHGCLETEVNIQRLLSAAGPETEDVGSLLEHMPADASLALGEEMGRQADVLGLGIANLISVFNPETVVLGGFLSALYEARADRIERAVAADAFAPLADHVRIERAQLGENLLMVGAAEMVFAPLLHDPTGVTSM